MKANDLRLREAEFYFADGEKYFILEDYTKALLYFQRVVELNPEASAVHFKIAEILARGNKQDDFERAAFSIETALRLEKKNKYYYLLASNIYASLNNFSKAEQVLETMMKEIKGTEEHLYELAAIYQYDKKPDEALKVYNKAENILGISEISSLQKQKIYLDQGKINEAIAEGEKLLNANPDEERYVMGFAEILAQKGQQKKAIEALEKFISTHIDAGSSKILLAGLYRDTGQESRARELLTDAFNDPSIDVSSKVIVLGTFTQQITQKRSAGAQDAAAEAFALHLAEVLRKMNQEDPNVHAISGDLYMAVHQPDKAEKEYLDAVQRGSATYEAWQNLLSLEAQGNKFDSLIFHTEQALEIFPNQATLYYFNGYAHMRKNQFREAATSLEQARRLAVSNPELANEINSMLGDVYHALKDNVRSDKAYEEALAYNPNNLIVLNNYSYYLAERKEHLEKAEKMAAQVVKAAPNNASFVDTYAWVLYASEKFKEARKVMEKSLTLPDVSGTNFEHYGDILFQLGDIDGAVQQWEKARTMTSDHELIDKKIVNRRPY